MYLASSYKQRRNDIEKLDEEEVPMISAVLLKWPLFEEGQYVIKFLYFYYVYADCTICSK